QLLPVQRLAHWDRDHAYRLWYPPWALALLAPFAALPYQLARFLWFVLQLAAILVSADLLWRYYHGEARRRGFAWIVGFSFMPSILVWRTGQITTIALLALAGLLRLERQNRPLAAGAVLGMAAIKPHLLHLLWIAVGLWAIREHCWRVVFGVLAAVSVLLS